MRLVEQAIFTSVENDREAGYQLVARSAGVCQDDAQELATWEPASDSLLDMGPEAESLNFHPLPSGAYSISRTQPAGWERNGAQRVYSHCLIVAPEILARFANNPFAVARAMSDQQLWRSPDSPCSSLEPFALSGGAAPVDRSLLHQLAVDPGPDIMATLLQAARDAVCLTIAGTRQPAPLVAGLFSCLPLECRLEFSFSTGLKFSPRRPFRIVVLSDDPAEQLWVANYPNVTVMELGPDAAPKSIPMDGWTRFVKQALANDHIAFLATQISKRRFDLALDDLPALGLQLLEDLDAPQARGEEEIQKHRDEETSKAGGLAHAPHRQFQKSIDAATAILSKTAAPNHGLQTPEVLEKLEYLDDLVYDAISGQSGSLEQLQTAWPSLLDDLGEEMLAESRAQYLRYALAIWEECAETRGVRNPARAVQALDVLCLLFGNVT